MQLFMCIILVFFLQTMFEPPLLYLNMLLVAWLVSLYIAAQERR